MDRQEYNILKESIVELIENKEFAEAADIADTIDWRKVRSFSMLQKISDLYKVNCRIEEAKDLMLLAYNYNPGSKQIVYSLCELYIELDDIASALKYLALFRKISPQDTDAYILQYKIMDKNEVKLEERIELLEEYCKKEKKEEWIYQLAYLYHRIGFATKCVETCDQLILWFKEGPFVIKAMELKMLHTKLSQTQQDLYDHKDDEIVEEMESYESEEYEPYDPESVYFPEMSSEDFHVKTIDMGKFNTSNLQKELAESMREILGDDYMDNGSPDPSTTDEIMQPLVEEEKETKADTYHTGEYDNLVSEDIAEEEAVEPSTVVYTEENVSADAIAMDNVDMVMDEEMVEELAEEEALPVDDFDVPTPIDEPSVLTASTKVMGTIDELEELKDMVEEEVVPVVEEEPEPEDTRSLQEIIAEKKKSYTKPVEEEELPESHHASLVIRDVEIPKAGETVIKPNLESLMSMEDNGQISLVLPKEEHVIERQITGQLDIVEIMNEWDNLLLRKEEEHRESIRESILRKTGKLFDDYEEATKNSLLYQLEEESRAERKVLTGGLELRKVDEIEEEEFQDLDSLAKEELALVDEETLTEEAEVSVEATEETSEEMIPVAEESDAVAEENASEEEEVPATEEVQEENPVEPEEEQKEEKKDPLAVLTQKTLPSIWDEVNKSLAEDAAIAAGIAVGGGMLAAGVVEGAESVLEKSAAVTGGAMEAGAEVATTAAETVIEGAADVVEGFAESATETENSVDDTLVEAEDVAAMEANPVETVEAVTRSAVNAAPEMVESIPEEFEEFDGEFESYDGEEEDLEAEIAAFEESLGLDEDEMLEGDFEGAAEMEESAVEEAEEAPMQTSSLNTSTMNDISSALEQQADEVSAETFREMNDLPDMEDERELSSNEVELFEEFLYSNKMKKQILDAVEQISLASFTGNVLITGDTPTASINLAKALIKEIQLNDANFVAQKVAKISGDKLNRKDIAATFAQLSSGALIVEKAGTLTKDTLSTITRTLESFDGGIIILLLDTVKGIGKLLAKYPVMQGYFNARIDILPMSDTALLDYAKKYAYKKEYKIDEEKGVLALAQRISELQIGDHHVTTMEVEEIVDEAIAHSKRPRISTFVDILGGKRYDYEDMIILREKDFS
ncbi:MAG: hypothetical protein MJ105_02800 [Lachnospiraceae bacterium]|nr:hypothetical protein [Lachnospiraceae bacterium]